MELLLWVVLLVVLVWTFFPRGSGVRFQTYEKEVHPYSGLDPESWKRFLANIKRFETEINTDIEKAADHLYASLENIRDLALGIRRADDAQHQEKLNDIAGRLGYEGEFMINQIAISKGLQFFPKYLNETIVDYPENGPAFIPSTIRNHGQ